MFFYWLYCAAESSRLQHQNVNFLHSIKRYEYYYNPFFIIYQYFYENNVDLCFEKKQYTGVVSHEQQLYNTMYKTVYNNTTYGFHYGFNDEMDD